MGERRGAYRVLGENPEGKEPVARPRRKWECNCQTKIEKNRLGRRGLESSGSCEDGNETSGLTVPGNFLTT